MLSQRSKDRLSTCDSRIIQVIERTEQLLPKELDFIVLCGFRTKEEQDKAFKEGKSKLQFPNSNHNIYPSKAVDIAPYPIDWTDINRFIKLATYVFRAAQEVNVPIQWGGHWQTFKDYPHWEIKE